MKTLLDLNDEYVEHLRARRYSKATVRSVVLYLRHFSRWLRENYNVETADRFTAEHLRQWHHHISNRCTLKGHPFSVWSINGNLAVVRGWLSYLVKNGYIHSRLIEQLPYLKKPTLLPGSVLTHYQVRKLLSKIQTGTPQGYRNRTICELLYTSAVRAAELLSLSLDDINMRDRTMKVLGKGNKERMVPIGVTAFKYLETYMTAVRPFMVTDKSQRKLFLNSRGHPLGYNTFRCAIKDCAELAGLNDSHVTAHTFRRSCTTEMIRSGANIYHVKELLGHESLDTLKHYVKLTINDLKKTHERCHPREQDE